MLSEFQHGALMPDSASALTTGGRTNSQSPRTREAQLRRSTGDADSSTAGRTKELLYSSTCAPVLYYCTTVESAYAPLVLNS